MTDIATLHERLENVPIMKPYRGEYLHNFVIKNRFENCLELGFAMGASASYIAGALDELGGGKLTAVDREDAPFPQPNIEVVLESLGLEAYVDVVREERSYTWFLLHQLENADHPRYDFVFIDGGHTWDLDGFAFLLVDRLLRPGGWVLFDDPDWSFRRSPTLRNAAWVRAMPEEEQVALQVRKVWDLLVKPNPRYDRIWESDRWGFAHKLSDDRLSWPGWVRHVVGSAGWRARRFARRAANKVRRTIRARDGR